MGLFIWSDSPNTLEWSERTLRIDGPYGTEISLDDLTGLSLLDELPEIKLRTHGISTERVAKGKFKAASGDSYLLLIDLPAEQILVLERRSGPTVLLSLKDVDERLWYERLQEATGR